MKSHQQKYTEAAARNIANHLSHWVSVARTARTAQGKKLTAEDIAHLLGVRLTDEQSMARIREALSTER